MEFIPILHISFNIFISIYLYSLLVEPFKHALIQVGDMGDRSPYSG